MNIVPQSQLLLMRKRKQFEQLIEQQKWQEIASMEALLYEEIKAAIDDNERSSKDLLTELNHIIRVYKELAILCHSHRKHLAYE